MRGAGGVAAFALLLTGCASGSKVLLFPGETADRPTGGVAVIDPVTGEDAAFIDKANSRARVNGARTRLAVFDPAKLKRKDVALLGFLPPPPRYFTLYFFPGTTQLTPESRAQFKDISAELDARAGAEMEIVGHTDSVGSDEDNATLSMKRATDVRAALVALDLIPKTDVLVTGRGEREPVKGHEGDDRDDGFNRRVEIVVR